LQPVRPLIFCDPENGWNEIITQEMLQCTLPIARVWEMHLRKEIFWGEKIKDDKVIEAVFNIPYCYTDSGYGLKEELMKEHDEGSFKYVSPINDYEEDFPKLKLPEIFIDYKKTHEIRQLAEEIFEGILTVRLKGVWWWTLGMTWEFIKLRGLENLMIDMVLYPEYVHKMMDFLSKSVHKKLDFLEENKLLSLNTNGTYVGSGGFGWTNQLPGTEFDAEKIRTLNMWGFTESQETVGVSPDMFEEFIFPYQLGITQRFGLNCYGCCEPLDQRWHIVKKIPRLRRVSVSPWANIEAMADNLKNNYVYSMKASPSPLADPSPNFENIRKELRLNLKKTKDCHVEIIMKDNHTLGHNPDNIVQWSQIAREEIENL
jgi:hypothetical protein